MQTIVSFCLVLMLLKPYLKCSFDLLLRKKWPAKISRFLTDTPGFHVFFAKFFKVCDFASLAGLKEAVTVNHMMF